MSASAEVRSAISRTHPRSEWRGHLLERLRRQVQASADPALATLLAELAALEPPRAGGTAPEPASPHGISVPLELDTPQGRLSLLSAITVSGSPTEVTLSEIAVEAFYPADDAMAERLCLLQRC